MRLFKPFLEKLYFQLYYLKMFVESKFHKLTTPGGEAGCFIYPELFPFSRARVYY